MEIVLNSILPVFWNLFKSTWWFWVILFIFWLIATIFPELKNKALREKKYSGIEAMKSDRQILYNLRKLKPWEFEDYIASLYSKLGYNTERIGQPHDGGIDVIIEKDSIKHFIQCKKFITRKVGASDIRDFYGAISANLPNGNGIFITTNYFTTEAKKFAESNMIETIDGFALLKLIKLVNADNPANKEELLLKTKICPRCKGGLILRSGRYGDFYGCINYPKCRFVEKK